MSPDAVDPPRGRDWSCCAEFLAHIARIQSKSVHDGHGFRFHSTRGAIAKSKGPVIFKSGMRCFRFGIQSQRCQCASTSPMTLNHTLEFESDAPTTRPLSEGNSATDFATPN